MNFRIENLAILFGLFALAAPIVLHFLKRRRFDVLDWGAMQFLPDSVSTQRRRWLDEILLLLMRMAMLALIVVALATPISTSPWLATLGVGDSRDVLFVLDGSYSMDVRHADRPTPWQEALRTARSYADKAPAGTRFAVVIARQTPAFVQEDFNGEIPDLMDLPIPRGNGDTPGALAAAWKHLQSRGTARKKEIVVFSDRQAHGWADSETLAALESLGRQWQTDIEQAKSDGRAVPSLRVIGVGEPLPAKLPNYGLAPIIASRNLILPGQKVTLRSALHLYGFDKYVPPRKVNFLFDGKAVQEIIVPEKVALKQGQIPLPHVHRLDKEGSHTVAFALEADDALAADNEQSATIEVVKEIPILLVDGDAKLSVESGSFFLQRALPSARAIPAAAWRPDDMRPAAMVLADVPRLDEGQIDFVDRFLAEGGGILIAAGERAAQQRDFYNERLFRGGEGWLPARLVDVAQSQDGLSPEPRSFQHPALELFRAAPEGVMKQARFLKWWNTQLPAKTRASVVARLSNGDPFLIEMPYKKGRVILCAAPLDRRWGSTFPSVAEYPIFAHEIVYYLAGKQSSATAALDLRESNLTRCSDDDWGKVRERLAMVWRGDDSESPSLAGADAQREELWWLLLAVVVGLLCVEVSMTRRMALNRGKI